MGWTHHGRRCGDVRPYLIPGHRGWLGYMRLLRTFVLGGALALSPLANAAAGAQTAGDLTVDKTSVAPGATITLSGSGCVPGAQVEIRALMGDIDSPTFELRQDDEADAQGEFSSPLLVPVGTPAGTLAITAMCGTSPTSSQTLTAETIVRTGIAASGSDTTTLAIAAGVLIVAGLAALASRRHATP